MSCDFLHACLTYIVIVQNFTYPQGSNSISRPLIVIGGSSDRDQESRGAFQEFPQVNKIHIILIKFYNKYILCNVLILWCAYVFTQDRLVTYSLIGKHNLFNVHTACRAVTRAIIGGSIFIIIIIEQSTSILIYTTPSS